MAKMQKKNLDSPDEKRTFEKGHVDVVTLSGITFGRGIFEPGWKWSKSIKPIAKTDSCQQSHLSYHISGRLKVVMDDGSEEEFDISLLPPGHDAWVVGKEPVVMIDISGMEKYAKPSK